MASPPHNHPLSPHRFATHIGAAVPGTGLCGAIAAAAYGMASIERHMFGGQWLEPLVLAILIGTAVRAVWQPASRWDAGVAFSAKYLLEGAVVLLGTSVSAATLIAGGPRLVLGICAVVAASILLSYGIGRSVGLPIRMALLVACGNSICGNSAIAAVAPVIGADGDDVAASITFTAVLGVAVVLALPLLGIALDMNAVAFGAFSGLTVYAVPQVIAAASPFGAAAVQMGILVKLVRVLMLGPVCLVLSIVGVHLDPQRPVESAAGAGKPVIRQLGFGHLVPWFIFGFLAMVTIRSFGLLPVAAIDPIDDVATLLTVVSMGALGLGVDLQTVAKAGRRVTATVVLSLVGLGFISLALLYALRLL